MHAFNPVALRWSLLLLLILAGPAARAAWLQPTLVRDINTNNLGSGPGFAVTFGSNVLFRTYLTPGSGMTWMTDGTDAGTVAVPFIDLVFGAAEVNGRLLFGRQAPSSGLALWASDGTSNGTALVKEILPGDYAGLVQFFGAASNQVFFIATDSVHGQELWRSDGTSNGTVMVKDIAAGPANSMEVNNFSRVVNGRLFFHADDGTNGLRPWLSDGTEAGTVPIVITNWVPAPWSTPVLGGFSNLIFFSAITTNYGSELWVTDGTPGGTRLVKDINPGEGWNGAVQGAVLSNNTVVFIAVDGEYPEGHGFELWRSDGTEAGTVLVKDLAPGVASGVDGSQYLYSFGGFVYFRASDGIGQALWKTDGTEAGTTEVFPFWAFFPLDLQLYGPYEFATVGDSFYFLIEGQLWKSDGTTTNTGPVSLVEAQYGLLRAGDRVVFTGVGPGFGAELWTSDGTLDGTKMLRDFNTNGGSASPALFAEAGGQVFFAARENDCFNCLGLWKTDLNGVGAQKVAALNVNNIVAWGSRVAIVVTVGSMVELWRSDGTNTEFLKLMGSVRSEPAPSGPTTVEVNGTLYLLGVTGAFGPELWRSDGTSNGTYMVWQGNQLQKVTGPVSFQGQVYFSQAGSVNGATLWRSDGTSNGTVVVTTLAQTQITHLTTVGDRLFFLAPAGGALAIYRSDGTDLGTEVVTFLPTPYPTDSNISMVDGGGVLFFTFRHYFLGTDLWRSDGTAEGTYMVRDIDFGIGLPYQAVISNLRYTGGELYFQVRVPFAPSGLWKSDGTSNGTVRITPMSAGPVVGVNRLAFFEAMNASNHIDLFLTDGTTEGTQPLTDFQWSIYSGVSGLTSAFAASNGRIFFSATDAAHGNELWTLNVPPAPRVQEIQRSGQTTSITITGGAGLTNVVEFSTDIGNWSPLVTNSLPGSGTLSLQHTNSATHLFYRTRQFNR